MTENPFKSDDVGNRQRTILESIARKQAHRPAVDANGKRVGPAVVYRHGRHGELLGDPETTPDSAA